MMRGRACLISVLSVLLLFTACKPKIPDNVIQPDEMEDLLYDYHIAQGMANVKGDGSQYLNRMYTAAALKKHHVTQAEFDSSLVYYYTRSDRFIEIYTRVQERLGKEALVLGASNSEVERYITQSQSGDTTDVWEGKRRVVLIKTRPYNLFQFALKTDTSYHAGDTFMMTFTQTFLEQRSSRNVEYYIAVTYMNDSTITQNGTIMSNGSTAIRIPVCQSPAKAIRGYICLGAHTETNAGPEGVCMLFLDRIRLIRFHQKEKEEKKDSLSVADVVKNDTLSQRPDSTRRTHKLGERPVKISKD